MSTLVLTRSDTVSLLDTASIVPALRDAFIAYSMTPGARARRVRAGISDKSPGTTTVLFPGTTPAIPAFTVKIHAKFPRQDPAIRGVLCLHDLTTGALLAIMESSYLTAVRTGISGALAADVLSAPGASDVAIIGAGVQGRQQLRCLASLRRLRRVRVYDIVAAKSEAYADTLISELGLCIEVASSVEHAVEAADIILTATWARAPFLRSGMLKAGAHVTTLGADEPGKAEVSADVLRSALFVCDDRKLAIEMGALGAVGLGSEEIAAELGEVLNGSHPGRTDPRQITVFGGVGLAFQDAVTAWAIYQEALRCSVGEEVDFLA